MNRFNRIVSALVTPLVFFNLALMLGGAVWLVLLKQMQVLWLGIIMLVGSPYIIPIMVIPAGIFSHFMGLFHSSGQARKERVMFLFSLGYIFAFLSAWCMLILSYVTSSVAPAALAAGIVWAAGAALMPLMLWASRDRANIFILTTVEVAHLAFLAAAILRLQGVLVEFLPLTLVFGGIMAFFAVLQAFLEKKFMEKPAEAGH